MYTFTYQFKNKFSKFCNIMCYLLIERFPNVLGTRVICAFKKERKIENQNAC